MSGHILRIVRRVPARAGIVRAGLTRAAGRNRAATGGRMMDPRCGPG
jgi:hypothetical protein